MKEYPGVDISYELFNVVKGVDVVSILTGHDEYFGLDARALKGFDGAGTSCDCRWVYEGYTNR